MEIYLYYIPQMHMKSCPLGISIECLLFPLYGLVSSLCVPCDFTCAVNHSAMFLIPLPTCLFPLLSLTPFLKFSPICPSPLLFWWRERKT